MADSRANAIPFPDALARALSAARRLPVETLPLAQAAGRIAAQAFVAPFDLPGFANSAMDGYAVRAGDLAGGAPTWLPLAGRILAGDTAIPALPSASAVAIMTGAPMPAGADTVVIQEDCRLEGDRVLLPADIRPGANVRESDDDCAAGTPIFAAGQVLDAGLLAVLSAFGVDRVEVSARPRVAVLVTGDELIAPGAELTEGLRYESNGILLRSLASAAGADVVACERAGDDPARLEAVLRRLAGQADMLVTSGGVSAGVADHLPALVGKLGRIVFWKVRMKPGMPVLCGRIGDCAVFALPGNPVSAGVTFQTLARPVLDATQGRTTAHEFHASARLAAPWRKRHGRLEFLRVRLYVDDQGGLLAEPFRHQGSGALTVLAQADGLAVLPEGARDYQAGELVQVRGWRMSPWPKLQP